MGLYDSHAYGEVGDVLEAEKKESLVRLLDVVLGYEKPLMSPVNLEICRGQFWGMVGPNGAGKTTLAKTLMGLIPPLSGTVDWQKSGLSLSYTPQRHNLDPRYPLSALDVVLMGRSAGLSLGRGYTKEDRSRALEELARIDLEDVAKQPFRSLSGGQQQRILLARALVADPDLLILDEPAEGMDLMGAHDVLAFLREANVQTSMAVLMISHHLDDVISSVDHLCFVNKSKNLFEAGTCCDMASAENLSKLFGRTVETHSCAGKTHVHVQGDYFHEHVHRDDTHVHVQEEL